MSADRCARCVMTPMTLMTLELKAEEMGSVNEGTRLSTSVEYHGLRG